MNDLFWLRSPKLLLWFFQLCYLENSLSITLICYSLVRDPSTFVQQVCISGHMCVSPSAGMECMPTCSAMGFKH